ncbi:MAG: hypothetical protein ACLPQ6_01115 [Steroidobacteraceae bacterium]|jgi:hypothetical protein
MQAQPTLNLADTATLKLPPELLAELSRQGKHKPDFHVEGWKPSLIERLLGMFGLK